MIPKFGNTFLTTLLFFLVHLHASLSLDLPISSALPSTAVAAERTGVNCFQARIGSHLADTKSCLHAVLKLPDYPDAGDFHTNAPINIFKLPVYRNHGSCMVTVSIDGGVTERSSWDHIESVANSIAAICSVGQYPLGSTGGIVYVGAHKRIRVSIEKGSPPLSDEDGQNVTATA